MPPKRTLSPDPAKKRLIKRKVNPPGQRSAREENYVQSKITNVIRAEQRISQYIANIQNRLEAITGVVGKEGERAALRHKLYSYLSYKAKLDNDYGHWDDIIDNGYDRDDPDDQNYPPPEPPDHRLLIPFT